MKNILLIIALATLNVAFAPDPDSGGRLSDAAIYRSMQYVTYNGTYQSIKYPMGDIGEYYGVCTDVVIRSYRIGLNVDLQKLIHEDMVANFDKYPTNWGLTKPDSNIDHRRTQNQECFFKRQGASVPITNNRDDYLPGDLVYYGDIASGHVGIVVNKFINGRPMVVHNIGAGPKCEDFLFKSRITGHYRWLP
tara:strand:+ start:11976 stop:12551 length:576 start_codon:yes stop_codon:yes gene_type:complete